MSVILMEVMSVILVMVVISVIINPWRMREGYSSRCVCVSVTALAATYLLYTLNTAKGLSKSMPYLQKSITD